MSKTMSKTSIYAFAAIAAVATSMAGAAPAFAINPQPLPPIVARFGQLAPGAQSMLNPQPLPPRIGQWNSFGGSAVMINPQPLPPRQFGFGMR